MAATYQPKETRTASILLVEDDDVDVAAVRRALAVLKIVNPIYRARDGIEALEILRGENDHQKIPRPYIIILDLNMPRMDGGEFLADLRADPELSDAIVFVLTTSRDELDKRAVYAQHVAGYIVKEDPIGTFRQAMGLIDHYWRMVELP